jgi:hypothetical protein
MKRILSLISALFVTGIIIAQDSSKLVVSIPVAYRDVKFVSYFVYNNDDVYGNLRDTINARFRPGAEPNDNTTSTIGAEIGTWLAMLQFLRNNPDAIKSNTFKRIDDELKLLVSQSYLIRNINLQDTEDQNNLQIVRQLGKLKIKRSQQ